MKDPATMQMDELLDRYLTKRSELRDCLLRPLNAKSDWSEKDEKERAALAVELNARCPRRMTAKEATAARRKT